jgi:hypothetical protein
MWTPQAAGKAIENLDRGTHGRVHILGVGDVEAQSGRRQLGEDGGELVSRLAAVLARVHVLDEQPAPKPLKGPRRLHGVRVEPDRVDPDGNPYQQPDEVILGQEALLGGRVDAHIPEGESGSSGEELEKIGELGL